MQEVTKRKRRVDGTQRTTERTDSDIIPFHRIPPFLSALCPSPLAETPPLLFCPDHPVPSPLYQAPERYI
ncbi:hypothetical protein [Sphingobacterium faecium]|uniref:hypothetical protein n=1 Tax=Sphingobacterium faecium TaxID=34087 RepID=UPI0011B1E2B4|nr:hypothetical protein [Sphingobacterium faecium]